MCVRSCGSSANVSMRSYSATPNLMTLQGRGFGPFFQVFSPAPRYIEGPLSLLKRATCRSLQVARFSTSRQSTPRCARESGIFSLGPTRLRFLDSCCFQDSAARGLIPLHVAFRPYLIQRSIAGFCRTMNPVIFSWRPLRELCS